MPDFYMMIACLMAYLLTAYHLTSRRDRAILIGVLWVLAAVEVWCGLIQFLKDPKFMLFGLMRAQTSERASGLFINPNHFAGFLETVAILSLGIVFWSRWPVWSKLLGFYIALSCWLGVAISGSRGGYFATIATLALFSTGSIYTIRLVDPRKFTAALIGALAAVALMVGLAAFLMGHSELLTRRMDTMVVKDVRIYNWEAALDHIRVSPWTGTGSGTHLIYGRLYRRPQIQADPVHAHCDYLELIAEYGIAGGICMLLFVVFHVRSGLNAFSVLLRQRLLATGIARSDTFATNFGALCAVAGLAVHSVVDFNMHIPGNALLFAFIFGMLANPGIERPAGFFEQRLLPWGRLLLPALGAWMIWAGLPLLPAEWAAEQARQALRDQRYREAIADADIALGRPNAGGLQGGEAAAPVTMGLPWTARFGGIAGLVKRFGPEPWDPDLYFYLGEANRALASRMPFPILQRPYFSGAIDEFRAELAIFPQDENALIRMAQCYDGLKQYQDAEEVYLRCFKVDPNLGILYDYYATHLTAEGKPVAAEAARKTGRDIENGVVDSDKKAYDGL